ncbi:MAG: hypothetical protein MJ097_03375 [Dorea sp.]|nr:hypothetical protein [Dorea sp.]
MKKSLVSIILLALSLLILLVPFAGMTVAKTDSTTENRTLAELPSISGEDGFNTRFFQELGAYFEDHFAFKNQLVTVDSAIQSKVFKESNVDTIAVGQNDWLYYTASIPDYLGSETVSDREAYNIAYNIALMQKKAAESKCSFLFTVAPNKNSLYGDNMPYYDDVKVSDVKNITKVTAELENLMVPYADLYTAFEKEPEILYLKRDSHWNEKGAVLAHNTIMDALGKDHETYATVPALRTKTKVGDLDKALNSLNTTPEWDIEYQFEPDAAFANEAEDWEADWIETENSDKKAKGSLLMFRDSFGISLCKYTAEEFKKAAFSRNTVYFLDSYMEQVKPDTLLVEIVERNLTRFGKFSPEEPYSYGPPIMSATKADIKAKDVENAVFVEESGALEFSRSLLQPTYLEFDGYVDKELVNDHSKIYIEVTSGGVPTLYDAFLVNISGNEYGYVMYLNSDDISTATIDERVIVENDGMYYVISEGTLEIPSDEMTE